MARSHLGKEASVVGCTLQALHQLASKGDSEFIEGCRHPGPFDECAGVRRDLKYLQTELAHLLLVGSLDQAHQGQLQLRGPNGGRLHVVFPISTNRAVVFPECSGVNTYESPGDRLGRTPS
ncbi:hypothetical protein BH11PSE1_BH11PSE1_10630 [soil metagenome]